MSGDHLIYRNLWLVVGWLLVVTVIYLSLVPSPPQLTVRFGDRGGHLLAYASLMFWFGCLYAGRERATVALSLMLMGLALELLQSLGSSRVADPMDMLANGLGIILGWTLARSRASRVLAGLDTWLGRLRA